MQLLYMTCTAQQNSILQSRDVIGEQDSFATTTVKHIIQI